MNEQAIGMRNSAAIAPAQRADATELGNKSVRSAAVADDGAHGDAGAANDGDADRISIEERLRAEVAFYKSMLEGAADVTTLNSPDGTILYASASIADPGSLGYPVELVIGRNCFDIIHPDDRAAVTKAIASDLAGVPTSVESRVLRSNGQWMWTEMRGKAIVGLDGKTAIVAYSRNIDERKRLQQQLAKSEEYYKAVLHGFSDLVTVTDRSGVVRFVSDSVQPMLGYLPAEVLGRPIFSFLHEDDLALAIERFNQADESGRSLTGFRVRRKDGSWCQCEGTSRTLTGPDGEPLVLITTRDVTERESAERERALLAAVVTSSRDAIMNLSPEARIVTWNPAAEKAYGFSAAEAVGKGIDLFVPAEELAQTLATIRRVLETGRSASFEQHARRRDGTRFISAVSSFPVCDAAGKVTGVASIGRDITALKETERELVAAREAALAASQAKSEFLATMSHEIRTPMTAILGMAELLAEGQLSDEQRRYIEILDNNGHQLLDLINSILDLAKIESGRLTLENVAFDLSEVVEKSAQALAMRAHAKNLELVVNIAPDVPTALQGDPLRLRQVLINLIGNAIKFTEAGEVLVTVERDCAAGDDLRLKFSIRDTGIGIARDKLATIFNAFAQGDSSTARRYGGSGLGLAIVKRLVTLMNGQVAVESEPAKGSVFSFSARFGQPLEPRAAPSWLGLAGVPILVVDDNRTARGVLVQMLAAHGARVKDAASYADGVGVLDEAAHAGSVPRIVLVDDRDPAAGRGDFERLIRAAARSKASTVAMISCDNLAADLSRLRSLKVDFYLTKPIDPAELGKLLGRLIAGDRGEQPPETGALAKQGGPPLIVGRPLKILFADDSADNRTLIRAFLKKTPYQLDEVENGRQAIEKFEAGAYDLVLMDIQMPEVDGYTATRAIRTWEHHHGRPHTPVIALTASALSEAIRRAGEAGCDAHVPKPVNKATLLRAIYDAVQACAGEGVERAAPPP